MFWKIDNPHTMAYAMAFTMAYPMGWVMAYPYFVQFCPYSSQKSRRTTRAPQSSRAQATRRHEGLVTKPQSARPGTPFRE